MSEEMKQALCCVCGNVRICRRPRNYRPENRWLHGPVDRDWHRETGDLKCDPCGRVTRHAIVTGSDYAEVLQRVATGNSHTSLTDPEIAEVRRKFRQGLLRNPHLRHFTFLDDDQAAWDAGRRTVNALCGEPITLDRDPSGSSSQGCDDASPGCDDDRQIKPELVRDQGYEDSDTGLSWTELDCVDCLRVWHSRLLGERQESLATMMTEFLAELLADKGKYPKKIDLRAVDHLIEALESARQRSSAQSESTAR